MPKAILIGPNDVKLLAERIGLVDGKEGYAAATSENLETVRPFCSSLSIKRYRT